MSQTPFREHETDHAHGQGMQQHPAFVMIAQHGATVQEGINIDAGITADIADPTAVTAPPALTMAAAVGFHDPAATAV